MNSMNYVRMLSCWLDESSDPFFLLCHLQSKPSQVRGRRGHDGEMQCEEEDACTVEQPTNGKQLEDAPQQSEVHPHEHQHLVSAS